MSKHEASEEPAPSAPEWIVTFSDMVSLLVTFFVMLMSFSTLDDNEAVVVLGAFGRSRGGIIESSPSSAVKQPPKDRMIATNPLRGADRPHARPPEELPKDLESLGQKPTDDSVEIDFSAVPDGLLITFDERAAFAPGSVEVNAALRASLEELARVLEHYSHLIVIEGFTDDHFSPTPRWMTAEALGSARAAAAAEVMLGASEMARDLVQVAGVGADRPRVSNDTAAGRTRNRRVEVRVLALSKARARSLQAAFESQDEGR